MMMMWRSILLQLLPGSDSHSESEEESDGSDVNEHGNALNIINDDDDDVNERPPTDFVHAQNDDDDDKIVELLKNRYVRNEDAENKDNDTDTDTDTDTVDLTIIPCDVVISVDQRAPVKRSFGELRGLLLLPQTCEFTVAVKPGERLLSCYGFELVYFIFEFELCLCLRLCLYMFITGVLSFNV